MGARGPRNNPLMIAHNAMSNERMRPRRRLEVQLMALDHLWKMSAPPPGSRLKKFRAAYLKVARSAAGLGITQMVFDVWTDRLLFDCDGRDMNEDLAPFVAAPVQVPRCKVFVKT